MPKCHISEIASAGTGSRAAGTVPAARQEHTGSSQWWRACWVRAARLLPSPPCSCLQWSLCSPPSSSSLEGVFSPCSTRVLLGAQPRGHCTCHQARVAGAARAHGWRSPLAMHKTSIWLSADRTKLLFSPPSPGMCFVAGQERGHPAAVTPCRLVLPAPPQAPPARIQAGNPFARCSMASPVPAAARPPAEPEPGSCCLAPRQLVCKCCLDVLSPQEGLSCR